MSDVPEGAPYELERFELVLLKRPATLPAMDEAEIDRIQDAHLAYLASMGDAGHMPVAGPFDEQPDETLRGLSIYATGSIERARELANADPAVRAGRFEVDVMYFYCEKGVIARR
jgi:uncharacterized protein YciI